MMGYPWGPYSQLKSSPLVAEAAPSSDPGQALWAVEPILEIFVDQVKFAIIFESMQSLLGDGALLGGGWAAILTLDAGVDLGLAALQSCVDGF